MALFNVYFPKARSGNKIIEANEKLAIHTEELERMFPEINARIFENFGMRQMMLCLENGRVITIDRVSK